MVEKAVLVQREKRRFGSASYLPFKMDFFSRKSPFLGDYTPFFYVFLRKIERKIAFIADKC